MKYNVGDKVRIKSLDWYNKNKTKHGDIWFDDVVFTGGQSLYCGCELTIRLVTNDRYYVNENDYYWTDEMIECKVEEETKPKFKVGDKITNGEITFTILTLSSDRYGAEDTFGECGSVCFKSQDDWKLVEEKCDYIQVDNIPDVIQAKTSSICSHNGFYGYSDSEGNETSEWYLPEGYQFVDEGGNVINTTKIVLEKKKKEYPTTIEECCKILGLEFNPFYTGVKRQVNYKDGLLHNLKCLLIYRDAYWKLYGEEMGLDGLWEPDWDAKDNHFYTIHTFNGKIECSATAHRNAVLIFPTEEMRDAFYENFKEEIEICKELL